MEDEREEAGEGVVGPGEEILQTRVVEVAARTDVVYLISARGELAVVRATLLLDTVRATHSLTNTTRLSVCSAAEVNWVSLLNRQRSAVYTCTVLHRVKVLAWDLGLGSGSSLALVRSDLQLVTVDEEGEQVVVAALPPCSSEIGIAHTSQTQVGILHLLYTP